MRVGIDQKKALKNYLTYYHFSVYVGNGQRQWIHTRPQGYGYMLTHEFSTDP